MFCSKKFNTVEAWYKRTFPDWYLEEDSTSLNGPRPRPKGIHYRQQQQATLALLSQQYPQSRSFGGHLPDYQNISELGVGAFDVNPSNLYQTCPSPSHQHSSGEIVAQKEHFDASSTHYLSEFVSGPARSLSVLRLHFYNQSLESFIRGLSCRGVPIIWMGTVWSRSTPMNFLLADGGNGLDRKLPTRLGIRLKAPENGILRREYTLCQQIALKIVRHTLLVSETPRQPTCHFIKCLGSSRPPRV